MKRLSFLTRPLVIGLTTLLLGLSLPVSQSLWIKILGISGTIGMRVEEEEFEGCGLGFWKQPHHFEFWPEPYLPDTPFESVFGRDVPGEPTLLEALELGGGHLNALMRQAVAALLNAASPEVNYEFSLEEVVAKFQAAFDSGDYEPTKDELETANEAGCPLGSGETTATPTARRASTAPTAAAPSARTA